MRSYACVHYTHAHAHTHTHDLHVASISSKHCMMPAFTSWNQFLNMRGVTQNKNPYSYLNPSYELKGDRSFKKKSVSEDLKPAVLRVWWPRAGAGQEAEGPPSVLRRAPIQGCPCISSVEDGGSVHQNW